MVKTGPHLRLEEGFSNGNGEWMIMVLIISNI